MFNIKNNIVVPYTTEQMFVLVNDISSYSNFIPGCVSSRVLSGDDFKLVAKMDILGFGFRHSFVTQNFMIKNQSIVVSLLKGPLKSLFVAWKFTNLGKFVTVVECHFSCEFESVLFERLFGCVFKTVVNDTINSFVSRANKIYIKDVK